jgi:hypothetical protein
MRRKRALKGGQFVSILVAGFVGYVLGGLNTPIVRKPETALTVAVSKRFPQERFPQQWADAAPVSAVAARGSDTTNNAQLALFSPMPMAPQAPLPQTQVSQPQIPQTQSAPDAAADASTASVPMQVATAEETAAAPQPVAPQSIAPQAMAPRAIAPKLVAAPVRRSERPSERPGYMLNEAQIASIKQRLHLTPDQEEMWPAVEAALRKLAYTKAHQHGASGTQVAEAGPDNADVQDLKSAAIPLLMSFNTEQKDEVRSIVHVMGLDQLANQF